MNKKKHFIKRHPYLISALVIILVIALFGYPLLFTTHGGDREVNRAKSSLQSIYLGQENYKSINKSYYIPSGACGDQTRTINSNLFEESLVLENKNYRFCISGSSTAYTANAYSKLGKTDLWIKNTNQKNW
tara:strand:- start:723 stop:1115 length:393 start_codon:yes stop_codon:yes gene_type:complete